VIVVGMREEVGMMTMRCEKEQILRRSREGKERDGAFSRNGLAMGLAMLGFGQTKYLVWLRVVFERMDY
jgi:hypothetical protein